MLFEVVKRKQGVLSGVRAAAEEDLGQFDSDL